MNHILDTEVDSDYHSHSEIAHTSDREINLGIPTILAIFFGLALVCAVFFGFGYTVGRKSAPPALAIAAAPETTPGAAKPSPGTLSPQHSAAMPDVDPPQPAASESAIVIPVGAAKKGLTPADGMIVGDKIPQPTPSTTQPATAIQQPAISPTGAFMVQIAAVSSQQIADIELAALKKYGYDVLVRHEPQDQLLHVQIGPYATRKDAEAMRLNVLAHGFNAIVK